MSRKMKDSGIEWIGEIPEDWEVNKVKKYYHMEIGFTPDTKNEEYYDDDTGYDWITISDLNGKRYIPSTTKRKISKLFLDEYKPNSIPKGSLLYSFKLSVGQVAFADREVYSNEAIASFFMDNSIDLNFLFYSSYMIVENANENIYGAKILNQDLIKNAYIVFPPLLEQQKIANFLDEKIREIDSIIEKTKESIKEYKKYRKAIVINAVTKGINPNVKMKQTDSDWIGEIPEHWNYVRIQQLFEIVDERNTDAEANLLSLYTSIGVKPRKELEEKGNKAITVINYKKVKKNDIIVNKLLAWMGAIGFSDYEGVTSPDYDVYRAKKDANVIRNYYNEYFRDTCFNGDCYKYGHGIMLMRWRTYPEEFLRIKVPNPPLKEQQEIANYLYYKCDKIDSLIKKKEIFIEELDTYKKSLIYEYVTGKREVE